MVNITNLDDDTLLRILSYADLSSLVYFTQGTSAKLRRRFTNSLENSIIQKNNNNSGSCCLDLWQEVFRNHNFAPIDNNSNGGSSIDYLSAIRERKALWSKLSGKSTTKQCLSLPNRFFNFVPLVPPNMMHYPPTSTSGDDNNDMIFSYLEDDDNTDVDSDIEMDVDQEEAEEVANGTLNGDPPPVEFACDSFCLTSTSTGTEFVLLNPFSGSVEVHDNVLDNAIGSDEKLMECALQDASENIVKKRTMSDEADDHPDESSEVIAGEARHNRMNFKMYDTPPKQVLFSVNDYFDLDLNEYFGEHTPFAAHQHRRGNVTVDWVGVDSHIALRDDKSIAGNVIGAARILEMEADNHGEELSCTEIFAWSNVGTGSATRPSSTYDTKYVCRVAGSFYFLDIDANNQKLYAAFQSSPFDQDTNMDMRRDDHNMNNQQLIDIEDLDSMVNDDGTSIRLQNTIYCLPLIRCDKSPSSPESIRSYFPSPEACIVAQYPVCSFSVDPTGKTLLVGTNCGTVEVWETGAKPRRLQNLSVHESFMKRHRSKTMGERHASTLEDAELDDKLGIEFDTATETRDDLALLDDNVDEEVPHKHPTTKISHIYLPKHVPVDQCGFVTKQRSSEAGTTLLLWQSGAISSEKRQDNGINEQFSITAMINLPLSAQCSPEVTFDGRKIIVYGKDHIGQILLVYHVLNTRYDQDEFDKERMPSSSPKKESSKTSEESGGVINLNDEKRIKFVNRIRHAGLGGNEYYDSILLSANERFIMCNTKTGNLIGNDGRNGSEGLLVIDLQDDNSN